MAKHYFTIPPPSELRLPVALAQSILDRDGNRCVYCGFVGERVQIDHVRPRAHFSADAPPSEVNDSKNLVTACEECNSAKGPQDLSSFARMLSGRGVPPNVLVAMKRRVRCARREALPSGRGV